MVAVALEVSKAPTCKQHQAMRRFNSDVLQIRAPDEDRNRVDCGPTVW